MSRPTLFVALVTCLTLLCANTAWAQGDQPPPPPPLGDTGDEPSGIDTDTTPPPTPRRPPALPTTRAKPANPEMPVVRATGKNMGMFFRFAGLGTMGVSGESNPAAAVLMNDVGIKFVFSETLMLPIFFGMGLNLNTPSEGDSSSNWAMDLGAGIEYHFRIWRRFSPFLGGSLRFSFSDKTGEDNMYFAMSLGPKLGIEYYIADRLSLSAAYMFMIQIAHQDGSDTSQTTFQMSTLSGGSLTITGYF